MTRKPRIAVFVFAPVHEEVDGYSTDATFQHMLVPLCRVADVEMFAPCVRHGPSGRERVDACVRVRPLPGFRNGRQAYITRLPVILLGILGEFVSRARTWDLVWIVDPGVHSQFVHLLSRSFRRQAVIYIRSREDLQLLRYGMGGSRRLLGRLYGRWIGWVAPRLVRRTPTVVTGSELWHMFAPHASRLHSFVSSLVQEGDLGCASRVPRPETETVLVTVGRVAPVKGLEYLIEALAALPEAVSLNVVGPAIPAYQQTLVERANRCGVAHRVHFVGPLRFGPDLWAALCNADIFVHPSISEGTPKSLIEALAAGLPVVATAVGSVPELLDQGRAGLLVPPKDVRALASTLNRLVEDRELRRRLGGRAVEQARPLVLENQLANLLEFLGAAYPSLAGMADGFR